MEMAAFSDWIGRRETAVPDAVTPRLVAAFQATFHGHLAQGESVPPGLHWCLSPLTVPTSGLGDDGHPAKGGFLPPVPLPRRMWASGAIEFLAPLRLSAAVTKTSAIKDITAKTGKSGALCFVTVDHTYATDAGIAIRELQNIVYREAATEPAPLPVPTGNRPVFETTQDVSITPVTLFRYSALTFNAHRIHYDLPYAQDKEFYPDLVIHGPLQATLLLNLATTMNKSRPRRFSYKGISSATGKQVLRLGANRTAEGCDLAVQTASGVISMTAQASW